MASGRIVGIDLGTTHSVLAWADRDAPGDIHVFAIPQLVSASEIDARPLLPSYLYAPLPDEELPDRWQDAPWVIGHYARRRGQELPQRLIASAKSWLSYAAVDRTAAILPWGDAESAEVPRMSPVEASQRLLLHIKRAYNTAHPRHRLEHQQVVLTVPASFDQGARELTLRAAHGAGLNVRLLEEPQAAFYDFTQRIGAAGLQALLATDSEALVLVCDVGGGTTDLTLIRVARSGAGLELTRVAVGRHLLLGGDNMDLALAHLCEARLVTPPERLSPSRFSELVLACRSAKERLLARDAPEDVPITLLASGSALVGQTASTRLSREEVRRIVLDGFFPHTDLAEATQRRRTGILAFGLPYEQDPAITRHIAAFLARHAQGAVGARAPDALLINGGVFLSSELADRLAAVISSWSGPVQVLSQPHPDLAVARGAVVYGLALAGFGARIGGGSAHGYYVGLEGAGSRRAVCVVPRGSKEGERHVTRSPLALRVGRPVRFELFAADSGPVHGAGQIVTLDDERFERLPPVATTFEGQAGQNGAAGEEVPVVLEGELSALGTLELGCVETGSSSSARHFRLAFELRGAEPALDKRAAAAPTSGSKSGGQRLQEAFEAIQRVFGKGRTDVKPRETKDLLRELERLLGERATWTTETTRALFDVVGPKHRARRRSADHERMYWMLSGYCLRPGFGHPLDPQRVALLEPLFAEGLAFPQEARGWQQFFIAWRRVAAGLHEPVQLAMRSLIDPYLAPAELKVAKPKSFKPQALDEMIELASWLERVPAERRSELARHLLERTWTARDPRLWAAIGRIGSRVPAYASVHHVIAPNAAERLLDHLLREKWEEMPSAPRAAMLLARVTGDRARDVSESARGEVRRQLERIGARADWIRAVSEFVPVAEAERIESFGEELPVGLRLLE